MAKRRPGRDPEMQPAPGDTHGDVTVVDVERSLESAESVATSKRDTPDFVGASSAETSGEVQTELFTDAGAETQAPDMDASDSDHSGHSNSQDSAEGQSSSHDSSKVEINFKGSEILRAKFPKPFEVAEQIASEWVHDGRFEGLPLGHPLAQYFAAKGLRKAKEIEKKVVESPMTEKLAMQALTAGMKAQEIINQVRSKVRK